MTKITVVDFRAPCFFFRRRGEEFTLKELTPKGICPKLFSHIYPQYLSLLYNGQPSNTKSSNSQKAVLRRPGTNGKRVWSIRSKPLLLSSLINLAEEFFRLVGKPKDLFDKKIIIKLLGTDETLYLNQYAHLWGKFQFCPALFYTIYPFLTPTPEMLKTRSQKPLRFQCPAETCAITVEVSA